MLLGRMTPEHKFATAARLAGEVVAGVAEGSLSLPACSEVLADALRILACPAMKVRCPTRAGWRGHLGASHGASCQPFVYDCFI